MAPAEAAATVVVVATAVAETEISVGWCASVFVEDDAKTSFWECFKGASTVTLSLVGVISRITDLNSDMEVMPSLLEDDDGASSVVFSGGKSSTVSVPVSEEVVGTAVVVVAFSEADSVSSELGSFSRASSEVFGSSVNPRFSSRRPRITGCVTTLSAV